MSGPASAARAEPLGAAGISDDRGHPIDRVVALFSGPAQAAAPEPDDWSTALTAVRDIATRVRGLQTNARDSIREAQRAVREAEITARAAEERARHAEVLLRDAVARAERAEEQVRTAAERIERAEAQTAEARAWLRRMHDCMVSEFGALTEEPALA